MTGLEALGFTIFREGEYGGPEVETTPSGRSALKSADIYKISFPCEYRWSVGWYTTDNRVRDYSTLVGKTCL